MIPLLDRRVTFSWQCQRKGIPGGELVPKECRATGGG